MSHLIKKLVSVWSSLTLVFSSSKKEAEDQLNDAISMNFDSRIDTVEDFEIAAYHNQG